MIEKSWISIMQSASPHTVQFANCSQVLNFAMAHLEVGFLFSLGVVIAGRMD